jgi:hypothetical protein
VNESKWIEEVDDEVWEHGLQYMKLNHLRSHVLNRSCRRVCGLYRESRAHLRISWRIVSFPTLHGSAVVY